MIIEALEKAGEMVKEECHKTSQEMVCMFCPMQCEYSGIYKKQIQKSDS